MLTYFSVSVIIQLQFYNGSIWNIKSISIRKKSPICRTWANSDPTSFQGKKKTKQNAQGYYVSSLVFFYDLKIDHSHFLYIKQYFSPWIIQLMEYARNAFTFIPHIHHVQKIRTTNLRGFIVLSKILQFFFQFDTTWL